MTSGVMETRFCDDGPYRLLPITDDHILSDTSATFIDGSVGHPNWFYAIGSQEPWNDPPGIPAYSPQASRVALWVRPDDGEKGGSPLYACGEPEGYVANNDDCDDSNAEVFEGAEEVCNGLDDDCNGEVDEGCPFGDVALSKAPQAMHFYPRNQATDQCVFELEGELLGVASELRVVVLRDDAPYAELTSSDSTFALPLTIDAGLHLYDLEVTWDDGTGWWREVLVAEDIVCGDVLLIDG